MKYKVVIDNWTSGLNELLNHQEKRYDPRTHRMRVYNTEKVKNERKIRSCLQKQGLDKVRIENPIAIHYMIYAKDKKHDRQNMGSCLSTVDILNPTLEICRMVFVLKELRKRSVYLWKEKLL